LPLLSGAGSPEFGSAPPSVARSCARATGSSGSAAAPASKPPSTLNTLRLEVRLAKPRNIFSAKRSN
jgi:hypothetical protein